MFFYRWSFLHEDSQNILAWISLVVIHNNCAVLNTSFCFLHFYSLKSYGLVLITISLDKALLLKSLSRTFAYEKHVDLMFFYMY